VVLLVAIHAIVATLFFSAETRFDVLLLLLRAYFAVFGDCAD